MSSATTIKAVILSHCLATQREAVAGGAITPGMLVTIDAAGEVIANDDAGGECQAAVAIENDLIGGDLNDAYAAGDQVRYQVLGEGERFYGIVAASQNIAVGDKLTSNGDGTLKEAGATDFVVAEARSAVVTGGGETGRVVAEVSKGRGTN